MLYRQYAWFSPVIFSAAPSSKVILNARTLIVRSYSGY